MFARRTNGLCATAAVLMLGVVLTGCDSGPQQTKSDAAGGPDVSAAGRVTYACQLAKHVQGQGDLDELKQLSGLPGVQITAATKLVGSGHPRIVGSKDGQDHAEVEGAQCRPAQAHGTCP